MIETRYGSTVVTGLGYAESVAATKEALASQGFGILTEIDVRATLREKLGIDGPDYVILGACNPTLAHRALEAEPEIGLLLPCNVIVYRDKDVVNVAVLRPEIMGELTGNAAIEEISREAAASLDQVLTTVAESGFATSAAR